MVITTKRLILRPWCEDDCDSLYKYAKEEEVGLNCGWPPHQNREESLKVINSFLQGPYCFAICLKENNEAIGSIELISHGISPLTNNDKQCELGFWIGKPFWNQGYISEASRCLIEYAFKQLHMERIYCGYYEGNERSKHVQAKLGFNHYRKADMKVAQLNEVRIGYNGYLDQEEWKKL